MPPTTSVLVPSLRRPQSLQRCLLSLNAQNVLPSEVLTVWQGTDTDTRDCAQDLKKTLKYPLEIAHCATTGIVPAEKAALDRARGEIIFMIDDDAEAPPDWISRHLAHYEDPSVGAVGGPSDNYETDSRLIERRDAQPTGKLTWYGRAIGNMFNQPLAWRHRPPAGVDLLVGNNLTVRRCAFSSFEDDLKPYWQSFEGDLCLQVKERGYRVIFDFSNVVKHYPSNPFHSSGREGDLTLKVYNPAYNYAFVLAKHSSGYQRLARFLYVMLVGTTNAPGPVALPFAVRAFGSLPTEMAVMRNSWLSRVAGWAAGSAKRKTALSSAGDRRDDPIRP